MINNTNRGYFERISGTVYLVLLVVFYSLIVQVFAQNAQKVNSSKKRKHILVLHSYHKRMLWVDSISEGIESVLKFHEQRLVHFEFMDSKRHSHPSYFARLKGLYREKYKNIEFSAVITVDDNAFNFASENRLQLFNNAPIVFCGLNHFDSRRFESIQNVTGVVEKNDYLKTINLALKLHPKADKIFVVNDFTTTGKANKKALLEIAPKIYRKVDIEFNENINLDDLKVKLKNLEKNCIVLVLSFNQDFDGVYHPYREVSKNIAEVAKNPVYTVWDFYFHGESVIGGCITRGYDHGATAGQITKQILNGKKASDIPIVQEPVTRYVFDYNKLKEFNIALNKLPANSIILNRPYSFYRENPVLFWQIALVILLFVILSSGLLYSIVKLLKSQKDLSEGKNSLRVILDSLAEAVVATDARGKIMRMNPVAEKLSGWNHKEAVGLGLSEVFRLKTEKEEAMSIETVLQNTEEQVNFSSFSRLINKNEKEIPVSCAASKIINDFGETTGLVVVFHDRTEENIIQEKLRHSQKMDAVGQLAGGVAHDFNNALSGIIGAVQLLQAEPASNYDKKILSLIEKSADRAADLTAKLLAFSRKNRADSTPQNFHSIVDAAVDILSRTIDRKILVHKKLEAEKTTVYGNFSELESVLLNLGINASHAMPDGGQLSYVSKNVYLDEHYCNVSEFELEAGNYILLEVIDNGTGIPPENIKKIFEPFFTTKKQGKGTGLGLSAAYGTIAQHEGAINVYSEQGRGSVFRIYLPIVQERAEDEKISNKIVKGTGNILLIDDEPAVRFTNRLLLEAAGYTVFLAENGFEGLQIFKEKKDEIDLVILDMIMPEMNGGECFEELLKFDPEAKIILCSGFPQNADVAKMKKNGLLDFIYKPCKSEVLTTVVAKAINKNSNHN